MPQLDFSTYPGQFLWLFFSFTLLYLFTQFVFFPRIDHIITSRVNLIRKNIAAAEDAIAQTKKVKANIADKLKRTNEQAQQISNAAEKEIKTLLEIKTVESESIAAKTLKEEARKLAILRQNEIEQHASAIIIELKKDILNLLTQSFSLEKRK